MRPGRFRFRGLAAQIVLWTVLPLTLVLIAVAFTGVYGHERAMRSLVEERDRALAVSTAAQVGQLLLQRAEALENLARSLHLDSQDAATRQARVNAVGHLDGLFASEILLLEWNADLSIPLQAADGAEAQGLAAGLARALAAGQQAALSPAFDSPWGEGGFVLSVPIYDDTGVAVGLLAGPLSASVLGLGDLLSQAQVGEHGVVYLVDPSGSVVGHSQSPHARSSLAGHSGLAIALAASGAGAALCRAPDGERMTLAYAPLSMAPDWRVIIEQPWHEVLSPVLRYSQFMPLVAGLAAVVALLTLYYGIHSLVRPLRALKRQAEQVAWGDFEATGSAVGGVEEIEDLRRALDQMARRIQGYQRGMHDYIAAMTQGQEEERKRLARELHDDTAQALIALGQQVEMAQKALPADPARAAERLAAVRRMAAEAVEGVRRFSRDLRPIYLDDLGFVPALQTLADETRQRHGVAVELSTAGTVRRLPPDLELAAYRIAQEALNNVVQHAQAAHAWVDVRFEPDHLSLAVRDDGQGFEVPDQPDLLARQGHFGLMGIQERALLYGGRLAFRSRPGEGTELEVRLRVPANSSTAAARSAPLRS